MTGVDGGPCRIRDVVRNSNIRWDIPLKADLKFDSFVTEPNQYSDWMRHDSYSDTQLVDGVFPHDATADVGGCYHRGGSVGERNRNWFRSILPTFNGSPFIEELWEWVDAIDDYFEEMQPPDELKCKIASYTLIEEAESWWQQLQRKRIVIGRAKVSSWPRMKRLLGRRFSSANCLRNDQPPVFGYKLDTEGLCSYHDDFDHTMLDSGAIFITGEHLEKTRTLMNENVVEHQTCHIASKKGFVWQIKNGKEELKHINCLMKCPSQVCNSNQMKCPSQVCNSSQKENYVCNLSDGLYRTKEISKIEANTAVISRVQQSEKVKKKVTPTICSKKARFESHGIKQSQIQIDNFEVHPSSIGGLQLKSSEDWSGPTVECSTTKHGESAEKFDEEKPLQQKVEVMPTTKGNSSNNNNVGEESKDGCSGENDQELVKLKLEYKVTHINDTSKRALELMNMPGITRELHMRSFKDWSTSTTKNSTITHSRMIEQREHEELKDMKVIIPQSAPLVEAHTFVAFVVGKSAIVMEARPYLSKVDLRAGIPLSVVSETLTILLLGDYTVFNLLIDGITMFLFDPGGCLCSLETWDVIFVVVSAYSFVLNVTIGGIKFYTQWAVGEVIANPNMFVGFMANELGIDLPYDSVYGMLMLRVRQDNTKLAHDNKRYTWYSIQKSIRGCVAYFDAYSDQLDVFKCHPLNRSKNVTSLIYGEYMASVHSNTRRALFLFDPGGVVCSLRACCDDLWTGLKAKLMSFRSVHAVIKNCEPTDIMMIVRAIFESCVPISSGMEMIYSCHVPYNDAATWHIDHMLKALYEVSEWFLGENGDLFGYIIAVGITKQLAISSARPLVTDNDVRDLGFWRLRETCMGSFMNFDGLFHESEFRNDGRQTLNFDLGGNQGWEYRVAQMGVKFTVSVKSVAEKIWGCGNRSRAIGFIGGTLSITVYSHHIECFLEVSDSSSYFVTMKITTVPWPILTRCESLSLKILSSEPRKYVLLSVIVQMWGLPAGSKTKIEDNLDEFSLIGKAEPFPLVDYKEWKNYGENVQEIAIAWEEDYYLVMDIKIADLCWTWVKKTLRLFFKLVNGLDPPMKSGDEHEELKEEYYGFARGRAFFLFRGMEMM